MSKVWISENKGKVVVKREGKGEDAMKEKSRKRQGWGNRTSALMVKRSHLTTAQGGGEKGEEGEAGARE